MFRRTTSPVALPAHDPTKSTERPAQNDATAGTVIACFVGNFVSATPMVTTVFGFFLVPISTEFGWPRANVSVALAIVAVTSGISYPLIGALADRYGPRKLILVGSVLFASMIATLSRLDGSLLQFYGLYALLGMVAAIPSPMLYAKVISGWFRQKPGFLLGLTAGGGNGAGATIMSIVTPILMLHYGWRGAYLGIGCITAILGLPILYGLLRNPPRHDSASARSGAALDGEITLSQARRTGTFWMILIAITLGAGCMTAVFSHVMAMLTDHTIAISAASSVVTIFALTSVCWQITVGYLLDHVRSPKVAAPFFVAGVAGLLMLQNGTNLGWLYVAAIFMGIALGTEYAVLPYYVVRYFGVKAYGAIYGIIYSTVAIAVGFTPFFMDIVFDATRSYDRAVYAIAGAMLVGTALIANLKPYPQQPTTGSLSVASATSLSGVPVD
jgi:MFS family permease